jgi:hypothetical protein
MDDEIQLCESLGTSPAVFVATLFGSAALLVGTVALSGVLGTAALIAQTRRAVPAKNRTDFR